MSNPGGYPARGWFAETRLARNSLPAALFGSLALVAAGTPEGPAEVQMLQAAIDVVQINLNTVVHDLATGVSGADLAQAFRDLNDSLVQLVHAERRFAADTRADLMGGGSASTGSMHGLDLDDLGELFVDLSRSAHHDR
jgi:hypothetical protein